MSSLRIPEESMKAKTTMMKRTQDLRKDPSPHHLTSKELHILNSILQGGSGGDPPSEEGDAAPEKKKNKNKKNRPSLCKGSDGKDDILVHIQGGDIMASRKRRNPSGKDLKTACRSTRSLERKKVHVQSLSIPE